LAGSYHGLEEASANYPAGGGSGTVRINAGTRCSWDAIKNVDWIIFTSEISGSGTNTINYTVVSNPNCEPRTGRITVADLPFTVMQAAGTGAYVLTPAGGASHPPGAGGGAVQIDTGVACQWTAIENVTWIAFTSAASGSGAGFVTYSVEANPDCQQRQGVITVNGQDFPVTQAAGNGTYTLTQSSASHPAGSDSGNVCVNVGVA
jgi:hypothetical protein